jgi:hypothetical protein
MFHVLADNHGTILKNIQNIIDKICYKYLRVMTSREFVNCPANLSLD